MSRVLPVTLLGSLLLTALVLISCPSRAEEPPAPPSAAARPKIGLVLGGGGARGISHVGVLKVLEELRVPVDVVVGTSMGAIVAGAYASGVSPAEMERRIREVDWNVVLSDKPPRSERSVRSKALERYNFAPLEVGVRDGKLLTPSGAIFGQQLERFLDSLAVQPVDLGSFDQLPIPYRAVATDIETGQMVLLDRGDPADAMRASMSVPGVFAPVEIDGRLLVDGGLVRNLPVDVARALGAQRIIAVNVGGGLLKRDSLDTLLGVSAQMINILMEQNVRASLEQLTPDDVLIVPELGDYGSADFQHSQSTIAIGEAAARKLADRLAALALPEAQYQALRAQQQARLRNQPAVTSVQIDTAELKRVNPKSVIALMDTRAGEPPDADKLRADAQRLMATDDFQQVRFRFEDRDGKRVLAVQPVEKGWGPNYLQFGMRMSTDLKGDSSFDLMASFISTWLNSRGLEWRNLVSIGQLTQLRTELYQPLDERRIFFVAPVANIEQQIDDIFVEDQAVARYRVRQSSVELDVGMRLGNAGEARLGYAYGIARATPATALPIFGELEQNTGVVRAVGVLDKLDNWAFPHAGYTAFAEYRVSRGEFGADVNYDRVDVSFQQAIGFARRHSVVLGLAGGTDFNGGLPYFDLFPLGGFLRLSGYPTRALLGDAYGLGRVVYYYRIGEPSSLASTLYGGASLEAGNVYRRVNGPNESGLRLGGSVFLAADTAIGPFYFALGLAQNNNFAVYLFLGRP
jgi:NTE family protein